MFRGGETLLLRDEVLDYWQDFRSTRAVEERELVRAVEPRFGRLVVFDPRIPHGVRVVEGTRDPRFGRLVIHGWFVQPRPFIEGPLRPRALTSRIDDLLGSLGTWLGDLSPAGLLSLSFAVDRAGRAANVRVLSDTTRVPRADERHRRLLVARIARSVETWTFGAQRGPSRITLPLVFERGRS